MNDLQKRAKEFKKKKPLAKRRKHKNPITENGLKKKKRILSCTSEEENLIIKKRVKKKKQTLSFTSEKEMDKNESCAKIDGNGLRIEKEFPEENATEARSSSELRFLANGFIEDITYYTHSKSSIIIVGKYVVFGEIP